MWCFHNGDYVKEEELRISPLDHGYLYGLGVFETLRTYDGVPVFCVNISRACNPL